jgi:hypothetical protein
MTQALYAHMNNKTIKIKKNKITNFSNMKVKKKKDRGLTASVFFFFPTLTKKAIVPLELGNLISAWAVTEFLKDTTGLCCGR